jgi:hypothetical protein
LAIGRAGAVNAALLAAAILAIHDGALAGRLDALRAEQTAGVPEEPERVEPERVPPEPVSPEPVPSEPVPLLPS